MVPRPRNGISICAGGAGLDMGVMLAETGFHTRCYVEWEEYPRSSIIAAQRAGYLAPAPIWGDLTTFDAKPLAGAIDTLLAGYPCQPFSQAGQRKGADDERHLWPHVARVIRELGPALRWVFLENVAGHVTLGADAVLRELRDMGFTPAAGLFSAEEVGATHERLRWFCLAYREICDGWGKQPTGIARSGRAGFTGGGSELAYANGGNASAERQQCGGEQRFHAPGRGTGDVDDAPHSDGGMHPRRRQEGIGAPDAGRSVNADVADAGIGRGEGWPKPEFRSGRDAASGSGSVMADTSQPGPQRREQCGSSGERHRAAASGSAAERGGVPLFPPGPGDSTAWSAVMRMAPDFAPAVSVSDAKRFADHLAQMVARGELAEAEAESELRILVDGLAQRSRALRLLGNGVCPLAAGHAFRSLGIAHGLWPVDLGTGSETDGD